MGYHSYKSTGNQSTVHDKSEAKAKLKKAKQNSVTTGAKRFSSDKIKLLRYYKIKTYYQRNVLLLLYMIKIGG